MTKYTDIARHLCIEMGICESRNTPYPQDQAKIEAALISAHNDGVEALAGTIEGMAITARQASVIAARIRALKLSPTVQERV